MLHAASTVGRGICLPVEDGQHPSLDGFFFVSLGFRFPRGGVPARYLSREGKRKGWASFVETLWSSATPDPIPSGIRPGLDTIRGP